MRAWQLLRESPPGYGGVERVAHELANAWHRSESPAVVFSLRSPGAGPDPLRVAYTRYRLPHWAFGRLLVPRPSWPLIRLLTGSEPLHVHLPCPAVLTLAVLARLCRPHRWISVHWHAFLDPHPTRAGRWYALYEHWAQRLLPWFDLVITTSPVLQAELSGGALAAHRVRCLPCCLPQEAELFAQAVPPTRHTGYRLICIGRLDSYKRVDWAIEALVEAQHQLDEAAGQLHLDVVGDGPRRPELERLAVRLAPGCVHFHGRLNDVEKWALLHRADLLVLPADRCNEAFGIVQLEAMCLGTPAVALAHQRSGTAWVSQLPSLLGPWQRRDLPQLIARLAQDPQWRERIRLEARQRYADTFERRVWHQEFRDAFGFF